MIVKNGEKRVEARARREVRGEGDEGIPTSQACSPLRIPLLYLIHGLISWGSGPDSALVPGTVPGLGTQQ